MWNFLSPPRLATSTTVRCTYLCVFSDKLQRQTCLAQSHLKNKKVLGSPVMFMGHTALMIGGRYPQKHMDNQESRELCLFDLETSKAEIREADWLMPIKK